MLPVAFLGPRQPDRLARVKAPLLLAVGVAGTAVALRVRDPHQQGAWGVCPFKALTGWNCPGCGGLRAVHDLTTANFSAAVQSNLLLVALIPLALTLWLLWVRRSWVGGPAPAAPVPRGVLLTVTGLALAFALVRNTPWGQGLAVS